MKNFNIVGIHQFLGEEKGVIKKTICRGELTKKESVKSLQGAWWKEGRSVFLREFGVDSSMHTITYFWCMPELKIGLVDVTKLNFDQSALQFVERKK